ncbi:MAG: choice-of-anchor Q domain-containing protein [Dokdonella sp.]|uniref:choice-of-anchor Q domain-containing protein n=1 Tax=Dokdonella sp. TaxID=2291710 RepID=UPI0032676DE2
MNTQAFRVPAFRRTILAQGLLLALSLGANAGASDARIDSLSATPPAIAAWTGDGPSRRTALDATSRDFRAVRSQHAAVLPPPGSVGMTNCNDAGPGSLREVITNAVSGDTIDLTSVGCSAITLTTGALIVTQNQLKLQGPTDGFTIGADDQSQVLAHFGNAYLTLDHMSIQNGAKYLTSPDASDARGGCIFSTGIVGLLYSEVTHCAAGTVGPTSAARGGAIYASGGVVLSASLVGDARALSMTDSAGGAISSPAAVALINSVVTQGVAQAQSGEAHAGGVDAGGEFIAQSAAVLQNFAVTQDYLGSAGGVRAQGDVDIINSSFALNASITGGGIEMRGSGFSRSIRNSTIAGNIGPGVAGILAAGSDVKIANSSIAWNVKQLPGTGSGLFAEGVDIELQSTLIAFNGDPETATYSDVDGGGTLSGSHNLIHTGHVSAPSDTIQNVDPLIVPAILDMSRVIIQLKPGSPAINGGSNPWSLDFDQRGVGFPREIGASTDIGSYEFDLGDLVFANSFD